MRELKLLHLGFCPFLPCLCLLPLRHQQLILLWLFKMHRLTGLPAQRKELWHQAFLEGEAVQNMIFFFFLFPFIR